MTNTHVIITVPCCRSCRQCSGARSLVRQRLGNTSGSVPKSRDRKCNRQRLCHASEHVNDASCTTVMATGNTGAVKGTFSYRFWTSRRPQRVLSGYIGDQNNSWLLVRPFSAVVILGVSCTHTHIHTHTHTHTHTRTHTRMKLNEL